MKMFVFEGSSDEISRVFNQMEPPAATKRIVVDSRAEISAEKAGKPPMPLGNVKPSDYYDEDKTFVTVDFAREAMTRIDLSDPLRAVLVALYNAHPDWVSASDLYSASGYEGQRFAGLMGAFGRRMKHTNGYDEAAHFFDYDWDYSTSAWRYRLPDPVREAIRLEQIA